MVMEGPLVLLPPVCGAGGPGGKALPKPCVTPCADPRSGGNEGSLALEAKELHRGRLIDHIGLVVADLEASRRFYRAILGALGIPLGGDGPDDFWADELFVSSIRSGSAAGRLTGRHHIAFQATDRSMVERFHAAGLAAGGADNGAPGERPYHSGYYAAFLLDPNGNNIEAVHHGPAHRSAASVKITF
jgi:catechol 2,3-dioxygenase-like lactoylglutathione lyase family enzyme